MAIFSDPLANMLRAKLILLIGKQPWAGIGVRQTTLLDHDAMLRGIPVGGQARWKGYTAPIARIRVNSSSAFRASSASCGSARSSGARRSR